MVTLALSVRGPQRIPRHQLLRAQTNGQVGQTGTVQIYMYTTHNGRADNFRTRQKDVT